MKARAAKLISVVLMVLTLILPQAVLSAPKRAKMPAPKPVPVGKPEIFQIEPRGIQSGTAARVLLIGTNLDQLSSVFSSKSELRGTLLDEPAATATNAWLELTAQTTLARGAYEISIKSTNAESSKVKIYVDDLPQLSEEAVASNQTKVLPLETDFWGTLSKPGDEDDVFIPAAENQSLVLDLAARTIGSKAIPMLTIFDATGKLVGSNSGFDGSDPLIHFKVPSTGRYRIHINDRISGGSKEHFYRLTVGEFPMVVGCYPLGVETGKTAAIQLIGFNLPAKKSVQVKAGKIGEMEVPIDPGQMRTRKAFKLVVSAGPELVEQEPNDDPAHAMKIPMPGVVNGRIKRETAATHPDADVFAFDGRAGQALVIETDAARRGSPVDTLIEVLHADGKPVQRLLLQAVRDSHLTFRQIDSVTDDLRVENWQEMELNQLMYLQGEVCKIFRMPQGPDSGFQFYNTQAKRRNYFDTSPVAHALDEAVYIVEPHPPGAKLVPNGLPSFPLYYANDDDSDRKLGSDSRLLFNPPADGKYLVRVTDTRGLEGDTFGYRLILREAKPDFKVTLAGVNPSIPPGAGKQFTLSADRSDGFDDDIRVDITGLPPGFTASTPVVIQAGHLEAKGTIFASFDATAPAATNESLTKVIASSSIQGKPATKEVNNFGKISLAPKPKLFVAIEPYDPAQTNFVEHAASDKPDEITIAPGQTIPAWLKIKRNGHDDLVSFTVESLPHGVIVDNIGLNGVLIPKGESRRQIFLTAAKWVPEVDRLCFAEAKQAEVPTSRPLLLHVVAKNDLRAKGP
jgi:hypothetical protein